VSATVTESAGSAPQGEAPAPLRERLGDRLNPLVVKEVRQGLRTRVFWSSFGLMLIACVFISMVAYATARESGFTPQGQGYFFAFFFCLGVVHFFIIPYSAYRSLAREREDETWVLLILTGLGPRRILRGKVASFLVQAALYASAVGPFLLFSYYLNGIDLPTILLVLVLGGAWLVFLTVLAVCTATLADGRMGRALVHLLLLGALCMGLIQGLVGAFAISEQGHRMWGDDEFIAFVVCALWAMLSYGWLLFETAAARLALATENYTRGPRLALLVQMVVSAALVAGLWVFQDRDEDVATAASILGCLHLAFVGLFMATDVDGVTRALRAGTRPWSLLRPGAVRGFRFLLVLAGAWTAVCAGMHLTSPTPGTQAEAEFMGLLAAPAYMVLYLGLALVVARLPASGRLASPAVVRILFFALGGLGGALPPLLAVLLDLRASEPLLNLFNPFVGMDNFMSWDYASDAPRMTLGLLGCLWGVAGLMAFAADRVLVERERRAHASSHGPSL
jgi:ABC-type transport system involved in multi-copper enzyme maturation permease subunit